MIVKFTKEEIDGLRAFFDVTNINVTSLVSKIEVERKVSRGEAVKIKQAFNSAYDKLYN